jgi:hypothetical protein
VSVAFASPLSIVQDVDEVANPEICGNSISNDVAAGAEKQFAANKVSVPGPCWANNALIGVDFHVISKDNTSQMMCN